MSAPARPLVLLDRDGVVNRDSTEYIKSPEEWVPLPGSLEAIVALTDAGFDVVVITNQSGIGRGLFDGEMLARIHAKMIRAAHDAGGSIAGVFYCPHHPDEGCDCRKPKPGLLYQAAKAFSSELDGVPFIGDKASDVEAALAAGARPIFIGSREGESVPADTERYPDLAAAAEILIAERQ